MGYAWNFYTCYNPCPISTFIDNNNTNCTDCNLLCLVCSVAPNNCSECQLSGFYKSYLFAATSECLVDCPTSYYK